MARFPGYRMPFQYYNPYNRNNFYSNYRPSQPMSEPVKAPSQVIKDDSTHTSSVENRKAKQPKPDSDVWLDMFGIKLYFDDVLILSLLFFLYKEEVKDEGLFLALVMLLIS